MKTPADMVRSIEFGIMKYIAVILLIFSGCLNLESQTVERTLMSDGKCRMILEEAELFFQDGLYDRCIDLLEGLLEKCTLSKTEKELSLELLAKAYIETDDPEKAETIVSLMLKNYPHYELNEQDNPESFNRLVKKYKIHPRLSIGIRNTLNWMNYNTTRIVTVDGIYYDEPYKKELEGILNDFNWMYYGWAELEFDGDISLNGDLIFKWTNFRRDINTQAYNLNFREQDNYIELPLYLKKYFHIGRNVLPYVTAGMGWLYMTKATGNAIIDYPDDNSPLTTGDINMLNTRNRSTFEWIAGAGVGYKMKNLRLFIDIRCYRGINSITNPEKGQNNSTLFNDFFYIDNEVRFNQFEMGASVSYTFINSVKRVRH